MRRSPRCAGQARAIVIGFIAIACGCRTSNLIPPLDDKHPLSAGAPASQASPLPPYLSGAAPVGAAEQAFPKHIDPTPPIAAPADPLELPRPLPAIESAESESRGMAHDH